MNDLRAYECLIEDVEYYESVHDGYGGYLGSIPQTDTFWGIYYATTPAKAKHQFIKEQNSDFKLGLEYTDPIKVRLLAKNVEQEQYPSCDLDSNWCKADLTKRGQEIIDDLKKAEAYEMAEEGAIK